MCGTNLTVMGKVQNWIYIVDVYSDPIGAKSILDTMKYASNNFDTVF